MKELVIKSGIEQLSLFKRGRYPYLEAYIDFNDNLQSFLNTSMKLLSIHMPTSAEIDGERRSLGFCDAQERREISIRKLRELIDFSNAYDVKFIIVHTGFFDAFERGRREIINEIADAFNSLELGNVKLCIENVPSWTNLSFENEPVISDEKHMLYFKHRSPQIGFVFDIDHLAINTVFQHFYGRFKEKRPQTGKRQEFSKYMEEEIAKTTARDPLYFNSLINRKVKKFLSIIQPDLIHAAGSDFCNYRLIDGLPLVGEALPLGYKGKINGIYVEDRLDYTTWMPLLPEDVFITIEFYIRKEYDYANQVEKNCELLKKLIRGSK